MKSIRNTEETKQKASTLTKFILGALIGLYLITLFEYIGSASQINELNSRIESLERHNNILEDTQNRMLTPRQRVIIRQAQNRNR